LLHGWHSLLPSFELVPGGQREQIVDPIRENVPAEHTLHAVLELEPCWTPKVPAGHKSQSSCPFFSAKDPDLQGVQATAPSTDELVPAGHALQAVTSETPDMLLNVAGGHGVQDAIEAAATVSLYVPDGQFLHCLEPGVSLNVPLAHGAQMTASPPKEVCKYPGSHRIGGNTTPLCIAAPMPLLPKVDIMTLGDAGAAAGLRKPEIRHSQGIVELIGVAPPAGNFKYNTRPSSVVSKVTTNAPEN
jgi:hypothetical protein